MQDYAAEARRMSFISTTIGPPAHASLTSGSLSLTSGLERKLTVSAYPLFRKLFSTIVPGMLDDSTFSWIK